MESIYCRDAQLLEQIDRIIEKILTVSSLNGHNAEYEFAEGCQTVEELINKLQGLSITSNAMLWDALNQLIEQRLPIERLEDHFVKFEEIKNTMLTAGMGILNQMDQSEDSNAIAVTGSIITANNPQIFVSENDVLAQECMMPSAPNAQDSSFQDNNQENFSSLKHDDATTIKTHLAFVLHKLFPDTPIIWDVCLDGKNYAAQVDQLLICLSDTPEEMNSVKLLPDFECQIIFLSPEDLLFPKRIERIIKRTQRSPLVDKNRMI